MKFDTQDLRYAKLVDRYSRHIESPVLRLKFLNTVLRRTPRRGLVARLPLSASLGERAQLIFELSKVLPPTHRAPLSFRITSLLYRCRAVVYVLGIATTLAGGAGVIYGGWKVAGRFAVTTEAIAAKESARPASNGASVVESIGSEAGLGLDKVWLAESGQGYEFYSNGARVLTDFQTSGPDRRFYSFDMEGRVNQSEQVGQKPVGIVYHLSEGDLLPFAGRFNSSLQNQSRALLEYARAHGLYNYVIDRFGRTYRIVADSQASNHAGNSIWSDGRNVFVNLSASFIGICLEGQSSSGTGPDGINEAQIYAVRVLTAVLRSKYGIEDANCVTHGLVSVNPSNKLMGYHTDWVAGFPFEAVGLTNKNEAELMAISRFGFWYDQAYIRAAGGRRWPGLELAERALAEGARQAGVTEDQQRRSLWLALQRAYSRAPLPEQTGSSD